MRDFQIRWDEGKKIKALLGWEKKIECPKNKKIDCLKKIINKIDCPKNFIEQKMHTVAWLYL